MLKHIIMFSTGLSSAIVLDMIQKKHGKKNTITLFTDTKWEDEDNYRFCDEVIKYLGANLEYRAEGRTPKEVWLQTGFLVGPYGSTCTKILKVEQTLKYLKENPGDKTIYFGIDADEEHRAEGLINRYEPLGVKCEFPLIDHPMHNSQMIDLVEKDWGIKIPRMYKLGFSHANCGGRCVKAGHKHFRLLLNVWPDKFKELEEIEREFREKTGYDVSILRANKNGEEVRVLLSQLREQEESKNLKLNFCFEDSVTPCECYF